MAESSATAVAAASPAESSPLKLDITPPKPEPKKSWADMEPDDPSPSTPPAVADPSSSAAASGEAELIDLNGLEYLTITADMSVPLEDPHDSDIQAVTGDNVYTSASTFEDLNLSKELIQGLYVEMRFKSPSKIQAVTLPMILTPPYKDLVAQAHNGSGKTTCFVLGMLSRVDPSKKIPQAICICPTRELAQQNLEVLKKMGKFTGITAVCAIPSDSAHYTPVKRMPPVTDQVVIGTPGTVKRWMSEKKLAMREVKILVFDEADHMLAEDGFKDDSDRIMREIRRSSSHCQVLLFSATFNETVKAFVSKVITEGNQIFVKKEDLSLDKVKQYKVFCPDELAKLEVIKTKIFEFGEKVGQTIIFVRTRNSASMLHKTLKNEGYECTSIQGTLRQEDREQVIREFKDGYTKVLITTDILTRGFDQAQVNLVINFDLPVKHNTSEPDYETYLHRIGRAGRFGRKGAAFNMMSSDWDRKIVEKIEDNFKHPIPEVGDWRSEKDLLWLHGAPADSCSGGPATDPLSPLCLVQWLHPCHCFGGLSQMWHELCDGIGIACLLNAALVLPKFKVVAYWHESSAARGGCGIKGAVSCDCCKRKGLFDYVEKVFPVLLKHGYISITPAMSQRREIFSVCRDSPLSRLLQSIAPQQGLGNQKMQYEEIESRGLVMLLEHGGAAESAPSHQMRRYLSSKLLAYRRTQRSIWQLESLMEREGFTSVYGNVYTKSFLISSEDFASMYGNMRAALDYYVSINNAAYVATNFGNMDKMVAAMRALKGMYKTLFSSRRPFANYTLKGVEGKELAEATWKKHRDDFVRGIGSAFA